VHWVEPAVEVAPIAEFSAAGLAALLTRIKQINKRSRAIIIELENVPHRMNAFEPINPTRARLNAEASELGKQYASLSLAIERVRAHLATANNTPAAPAD
jgi:hypothetical protein